MYIRRNTGNNKVIQDYPVLPFALNVELGWNLLMIRFTKCGNVIFTVNAQFIPPTESSLSHQAWAASSVYYSGRACFHFFVISSFVHCGAHAQWSARWSTAGGVFIRCMIRLHRHCDHLSFLLFFLRLESQLMTDIQTILQLLQRQPTLGPPAYSTVTASPDYHKPAVKVQPGALSASHLFSHPGTQVRTFSEVETVFPHTISSEVVHQLALTITNHTLTKSAVVLKETVRQSSNLTSSHCFYISLLQTVLND